MIFTDILCYVCEGGMGALMFKKFHLYDKWVSYSWFYYAACLVHSPIFWVWGLNSFVWLHFD